MRILRSMAVLLLCDCKLLLLRMNRSILNARFRTNDRIIKAIDRKSSLLKQRI